MKHTKINTVKQTAQSLFIMYNYLPEKVRQEFNNLLQKKSLSAGLVPEDTVWLKLSDETLSSIWATPENEIWDEFYLKQKKSGNV